MVFSPPTPKDEPETTRFIFKCPRKVYDKLRVSAAKSGLPIGTMLCAMVIQCLEDLGESVPPDDRPLRLR